MSHAQLVYESYIYSDTAAVSDETYLSALERARDVYVNLDGGWKFLCSVVEEFKAKPSAAEQVAYDFRTIGPVLYRIIVRNHTK